MYCVNEKKDAKANFSNCHSCIAHMDIFVKVFSATTCFKIMKFCVHVQVGEVYWVNEKLRCLSSFCLLFLNFQFFPSVTPIYNAYGHF